MSAVPIKIKVVGKRIDPKKHAAIKQQFADLLAALERGKGQNLTLNVRQNMSLSREVLGEDYPDA